jgi:nicotinamidase-related amidase
MALQRTSQTVIGSPDNFWLLSNDGYDLSHPPSPDSPPIHPRLALSTTSSLITIDPAKTALVIIDMQNYFLSPLLGRPSSSPGLAAAEQLVVTAIPACRQAGIAIVWLNWGLTKRDLAAMPPALLAAFGRKTDPHAGLGDDIGPVQRDDGTSIPAGRVLMRDTWNAELYHPLLRTTDAERDVFVHKNRLSGFWGGTNVEEELKARGIRTLLFAGVNTDQCVGGSLQDALSRGYDCLMLSDCCATTSPHFAQQCIEFNCERGWGFVLTCKQLEDGVTRMSGLS